MNKESKKLAKENEELEKKISETNNLQYTNLIVYLRASDISEYNQELVRRDIINMIIEGELRGDSLENIIGSDYKEFCNDIMAVFPPKTSKEKILDFSVMLLTCMYILGIISLIYNVAHNIGNGESLLSYTITLGDLISFIVIVAVANFVVIKICKDAFKEPKTNNKLLRFLGLWALCILIIAGIAGPTLLLKSMAFTTNIIYAIFVYAAAYVGAKVINGKI